MEARVSGQEDHICATGAQTKEWSKEAVRSLKVWIEEAVRSLKVWSKETVWRSQARWRSHFGTRPSATQGRGTRQEPPARGSHLAEPGQPSQGVAAVQEEQDHWRKTGKQMFEKKAK